MKASHLTSTILAALGLSAPVVACSDDFENAAYTCGDGSSREVELEPGCVVTLGELEDAFPQCQELTLDNGACPSAQDVDLMHVFSSAVLCAAPGQSVTSSGVGAGGAGVGGSGGVSAGGANTGGASVGGANAGGANAGGANAGGEHVGGSEGGIVPTGNCCYHVLSQNFCGRPFFVGGQARVATRATRSVTRSESGAMGELPDAARRAIGAEWVRDAFMEHASVASFARFALELMALGAPADLLQGTQLAMGDEIEHARRCLEMAGRYGAGDVAPGRLDFGVVSATVSLEDAVRSAVREGCVGETIAALLAARGAGAASDRTAKATLEGIAEDETRHAALAWRFIAWAMQVGGEPIRRAVEETLALAEADMLGELATAEPGDDVASPRDLLAHGRLPVRERAAIAREALLQVVLPCARALLAS